jgi:hypothetical protein
LSGAADGGIASHVVSVWQQHQCHIDLADASLSQESIQNPGVLVGFG